MDIRNYIIAKVWFHVLANPRMKNAECLNLLPNLTLHIALVYIYLKLIAVAKGRNKHVTECKICTEIWLSGSCRSNYLGPA